MLKYLITGAKGQVGSLLVQQLSLEDEIEVIGFDKEQLDISDKLAVSEKVKQIKPDIIINAAAYTAVDRAETEIELAEKINIEGSRNLAEIANTLNIPILHISTDYVFEGSGQTPYSEDAPVKPQNRYGRTKLLGEIAVQQANPKSVIVRTAWVFGEYGNNFVKTMLRLAQTKEQLSIVSDQFGGPTYAGDIAKALIRIAYAVLTQKNPQFGIYHFSGLPYVSWFEFAQHIFEQAKLQKLLPNPPLLQPITTEDYPTPAKRPKNSRLDLSKIEKVFAITPSDWQQALGNLTDYIHWRS